MDPVNVFVCLFQYSLPQPKGGRHAHNPVLAPDQKITYKAKRSRQPNVNPLHPDYIAQVSTCLEWKGFLFETTCYMCTYMSAKII